MIVHDIVDSLSSGSFAKAVMLVALGIFTLGMLVKPYQDLPSRVQALEASDRTLDNRLLEQERKLDLVICFLEMDANGMNPLACSR